MNIWVHVSSWTMVFSRYMPRSGIAGWHDRLFLAFLRKLHTVFHSDCNDFHFQEQYRRVPLSPHPFSALIVCRHFDDGYLTGVRRHLSVVLIFISPIISHMSTFHGVLKARILKQFAILFSSGPCFVIILHHDLSILGGLTQHGS